MSFADHFSTGSSQYATFRPRYPAALFAWLAAQCPGHRLAWDCATGNGQAATGLVAHFDRVLATDASEAQLSQAEPHPRIEYLCARADASGLPAGSADLVTVAQALHWLPLDGFYAEVARVLAPGGLFAAWGYALPMVSQAVDPLVRRLHHDVVGPYWPPGRELVDDAYRPVQFPFPEITPPVFEMEHPLRRDGFVGYLRTWSAVQRFTDAQRADPLAGILPDLEAAWPAGEVWRVRWPLFVRAGHRPA